MLSFAELLTSKTLDDWKKSIVRTSTLVGLAVTNWPEGGFTRTLVALFAEFYKTGGDVVRIIAGSGFLDTAEGDWLKLLAKQLFGVDAIEATFAKAPLGITLTNTGGGLFVYEPGDLIFAHETTNKTYRNTTGGTLVPGAGHTLRLDIEAEEAGSGSNASVGTITVMVTASIGVTCTNTVALNGLDEEKAPALRQRCRDSVAARSLGAVKKAYGYYAKSAKRPDGSSIGVTRVRVMPPTGDGTVNVLIADASGAIAVDDVAIIQSDFDTLITPYGLVGTVISATNVIVTAPCTVWIPASLGLGESDAQKIIFDALKAYVEGIDIGGIEIPPAAGQVEWRGLAAVAERAIPGTLKVRLSSEADIPIGPTEVPVWGGVLGDTAIVQVT